MAAAESSASKSRRTTADDATKAVWDPQAFTAPFFAALDGKNTEDLMRSAMDWQKMVAKAAESGNAMMAMQEPLMKLAVARMQHSLEAANTLANARTPTDAMEAWTTIAKTLAEDYQEAWRLMSETTTKAMKPGDDK